MDISKELFALADEKYRLFTAKLIPTLPLERFIGVRTPHLRALAKKVIAQGKADGFLKNLPHKYFEEDNLHAFIICEIRDFDKCVCELEKFLPFVNNWASCDQMSPKVLKKNPDGVLRFAKKCISSPHTYTVRFGMGLLMHHFLDERFDIEYPKLVASVSHDDYYVKMMQSWYFATALTKQYDAVLPLLETPVLEKWTHNKAIQKAVESYLVSEEQKEYLRKLKIKSRG